MAKASCVHLSDSINNISDIASLLSSKEEIKCSDCGCQGPNLWLCLKKDCSHIGCGEKSNDHSTIHNATNQGHYIHMNLSTKRVWCYECKSEVFLDASVSFNHQSYVNGYESDQEEGESLSWNKDSGHGSYTTLKAASPERGTIFENSVGLNVGMNGDGDISDSSDMGEFGDYSIDTSNRGLIGLQNIGNTCYMNAALQALSNTEPLTRYFTECGNVVHILSEGKKPGLSRTYQTLIRDMWVKKTSQGYVTPSGILYGIRNVYSMFRGYHQHDTQEFLRNFMDQIHDDLKQPVGPDSTSLKDADAFSTGMEDTPSGRALSPSGPLSSSYDSSEGEYETCDSGVSERSSLSDDSEMQARVQGLTGGATPPPAKRRLSRCQSPGRRQRAKVQSQSVIDVQPSTSSTHQKKQVKDRSIISDIFDGKLLSSVQCLTCDRISSRVETFQDLSLPIPSRDHLILLHGRNTLPNTTCSDVVVPVQDGWISWFLAWIRSWWYGPTVTLHDCLAAFFSTDELKGDNMYSCERCNKLRNGVKFSKVLQLPEVLCIHLKRFRHELMYSSKIASTVSFPLKGLDMWPYLHTHNTSKVSTYDLYSVICHHGTAGGGHYTSYALNGGQWYEFDDQYVTKVPAERVQNCEAYVLFYRKVQTSAEGIRLKLSKMMEEADRADGEIRKAYISRQWLNKCYYCVEPGPIDNSDFLCQHGAVDPDKELVLEHLFVVVPFEMYEFLHKRFGGCPPMTELVACPACTALQQRIINEMETFAEISKRAQAKNYPHSHYLSASWYKQWHNFIQKKTLEPPGPIDNSKINPNNLDTDEAADVPESIWDFFFNIYGGGPLILTELESDDEKNRIEGQSDSEHEQIMLGKEMGDAPIVGDGCCDAAEDTEVIDAEASSEPDKASANHLDENQTAVEPAENHPKAKNDGASSAETSRKSHANQGSRRGRYRRRNH